MAKQTAEMKYLTVTYNPNLETPDLDTIDWTCRYCLLDREEVNTERPQLDNCEDERSPDGKHSFAPHVHSIGLVLTHGFDYQGTEVLDHLCEGAWDDRHYCLHATLPADTSRKLLAGTHRLAVVLEPVGGVPPRAEK